MKLYISGPMTGHKDMNRPAFRYTAKVLRELGYEVISPADITLGEGASWQDYMREALRGLADADGLCLLHGWRSSRGAQVENRLAQGIDLPVHTVEGWIKAEAEVL